MEAAKKAISSPLLETSIDGAQGVLMNITGGTNLSLYEVQEAADIVASAADKDLNMIFGSIINESLKDEIMITVIATGFTDKDASEDHRSREASIKPKSPLRPRFEEIEQEDHRNHDRVQRQDSENKQDRLDTEDLLDIPTFLRNRNRNRQ